MTIYEDEIDLRPYINAIIKDWWKIGLLAISLAILVFVFTFLQAPSYQATATILLPRSQLQLSLADQFPTVVDAGDSRSRMDAYLTIAQSDAIAQQTYQTFKDVLPEGYTASVDPKNAWEIVDGKLYLNYNKEIQTKWAEDIPGNIARADANWPGVLE